MISKLDSLTKKIPLVTNINFVKITHVESRLFEILSHIYINK